MLYLAMPGTLYALERRTLWVPPLLAFALTLFHPSAVILLLVLGCHLVDALLRERREAVRLAAALPATVVAVVLAPGGRRALVLAFTAPANEMNALIGEYVPSLQSDFRWHFVAIALAGAASVAATRRRASDALPVAGFGLLAFFYVRNLIPLVADLESDPDWLLAVIEPAGMLFVRRDVFPSGATPLPKDRVWTQILAETEGLDHSPAPASRAPSP